MTGFKLLGVAAIMSLALATQALAQAVIDEPGNYAFFHPNADVLNPSRPLDALAAQPLRGDISGLRLSARPHRTVRTTSSRSN